MSTLTVTLDRVALEALDDFVARTGRSREAVVTQAIEAYVAQNDWQLAKIRAGLDAAERDDFADEQNIERVRVKFAPPA